LTQKRKQREREREREVVTVILLGSLVNLKNYETLGFLTFKVHKYKEFPHFKEYHGISSMDLKFFL
jgi:hypothetical protein